MNKRLPILICFLLFYANIYSQVYILKPEQLTIKDGLPHNSAQSILQDKYGYIWISSFSGLYKYDGYEFTNYSPNPDDSTSLISGGVYNIFIDSIKNIWISFFDTTTICRYNYKTDKFTRILRYKVDDNTVANLTRKKKIPVKTFETSVYSWTYTQNVLTRENKTNGEVTKYFIETMDGKNISDEVITCLFVDKFETFWLGTENNGIYKANTLVKPFLSYYRNVTNYSNVIKDIVRSIFVDKMDNIWIGTFFNGVAIYNPNKNQYSSLRHNPNNANSLVNDEIRSIYQDSRNNFWFGTKGGLSKYDIKKEIFTNYSRAKRNIPNDWVHAILEDHLGEIWIGTFGSLAKYYPDKDSVLAFEPEENKLITKITDIFEDKENNLWISSQGGGLTSLKRSSLDGENFTPIYYFNKPDDKNSLSSNRVFSITEDGNGDIWVATEYGLNKLNRDENTFSRITDKEGLPDVMIMSVLSDGKDKLWISHKKGLSELDINTLEIRNFREQDGLLSYEFSENACFRNPKTGEMFFGGASGLNSFFPDSITERIISTPEIVFSEFQVLNQKVRVNAEINGRALLTKPLLFTDEINLKYSDKSFSIKFAALHYSNPQKNSYEYMLENFDEHWIRSDPKYRIATYSNLPAGNYQFKVRASNCDGIWSPEIKTLKIKISPPWWNNPVAYFVYILIVGIILYIIYNYLVSKEKLKNEVRYEKMKSKKIYELDQMKFQFFTNVSHEFRTPLSLLIDPLKKLNSGKVKETQLKYYYSVMYQNAQHLLRLVNQLLDFRKIESSTLKLSIKQGDIASFIENIIEPFKLSSEERNINFIYKSTPDKIIALFDPDKIEKIMINLLSNAFKYTDDNGEINVEVSLLPEYTIAGSNKEFVEIVVNDNGAGIPPEAQEKIFNLFYQVKTTNSHQKQGTGIGLAYTKRLVELHGGEISVKSDVGKGAMFRVLLPAGEIQPDTFEKTGLIPDESFNDTSEIHTIFPEHEQSNKGAANNERPIILMVDDNIEVRTYLRKELEEFFEIYEAQNGLVGLEVAKEKLPDLIICDIMMPVMDGLEMCKRIKTDVQTSHIPVVLLSARQSDESKKEGYETGADAYIAKPFNTAIVNACVQNLIKSRRKLRESFSKSPFIDIKKIAGNSTDDAFLNHAIKTIEESIGEPEFNIELLSDNLKLSRRHLTQKIKSLTGQTVLEFVQTVRLNKAAELLITTDQTVSEIAFNLGYNIPANFSRSFSKQFGKSPTDYVAEMMGESKKFSAN